MSASASGSVKVRDLTSTGTECTIDLSDMPSGELTVQHILDRAGIATNKTAVLVDGQKVTDLDTQVTPGSEVLTIPQVING